MIKNIRRAFHPSFYISEYIEELQMTQDEFSKRLGITGKQVSLLLSQEANITSDIAIKLSKLIGTSVEFWLNLQSKYDAYIAMLADAKVKDEEKNIYKMIDKKFLKQLNIINDTDSIEEGMNKLRIALPIASLTLFAKNDIYSFYRTSVTKAEKIENLVCKNVWVSLAFQIAKKENTKPFNEKMLNDNIKNFRKMTLEDPDIFYPKLKRILSDCGVALVILPSLKNSNINGVVKWIDSDKVMMALNTRGTYNDKFWFSFFHELKHVLQKIKRKMIIGEDTDNVEDELEREADEFARETLIPSEKLKLLKTYTTYYIQEFATQISIHPGIVVGRLQKERKIQYSCLNNLKEKYEIVID
ncbi:MAG: HigA family addiction module antidote protein [Erysipelotrichales bacterium]|nr:HigA family addiction module antidote protein [Erysipelotrichales bacterium]